MKVKISFLLLLAVFTALPLAAQAGQDLLKLVDQQVSFLDSDFSAEYTIEQKKGDSVTSQQVAAVLRRDKANTYTIVILKPAVDKGKGYLKINNSLWYYNPQVRKFQVTSAKDRFQNSNARNSDFTKSSLAQDYKVVGTGTAKYQDWDCTVLDLEATTDQVSYPRMKLWISPDNLVRYYEDYSLKGDVLRTTEIPVYQKLGKRAVPLTITIQDVLRKEATVISIAKASVKALPDMVFTQAYLEKLAK